MAKSIRIERPHGLGREVAVQRLGDLTEQVQSRYGLKVHRTDGRATVDGKGVSGRVEVDDKKILVDLSVGLPASLVIGKIEQGIQDAIDKHFKA
jgi:putative polyhydroxyalkanoate system protein